ncbi:MAG TPA: MauE/DoxX family redox-associated membrane protein [Puia sp.]|jgi:hypothetical protein|nr:MauE/DoxX family redox-associated membrane protein [Puia sp.]
MNSRFSFKVIFPVIVSTLFIVLFVYAASSKLLDYQKFRIQLGQSPILTAYAGWVAWFIPVIEIAIAVLLASQRFRLFSFYASFTLMILFTAYLIAIIHFSFYVPCTCGGILQKMDWNTHIIFNSIFVALAFGGIITHPDKSFIAITGSTENLNKE